MPSVCVLLTIALPGLAQIFTNFSVTLSGSQEVPATFSTATGGGTITLDTNANTLTFVGLSFSGLAANSRAAYIQGPAGVGTNAGVIYALFPTYMGVGTSGTIHGTLPMVDSTFTVAQQLPQLQSGLWYLNIYGWLAFPDGEIRGQLVPVAEAVPEPGVLALSAIGFGLLGLRALRR
ncbi:MAG: CHRD domain-containing protein [Verrucomicrobia bacterium]|nr:CHRD domain-containing protein [Verrucomicrobiota bacterium]